MEKEQDKKINHGSMGGQKTPYSFGVLAFACTRNYADFIYFI